MKKALVLGGGGSKGAYEIGVWKALSELGIQFDIVTGTSVGACIGAMYVQGEYARAYALWKDLCIDDLVVDGIDVDMNLPFMISQKGKYKAFLQSVIHHKGIDISPYIQLVKECFDLDKFFSSMIDYGCMTYNLTTHRPQPMQKKDMRKAHALGYILASASCFPVFPMHRIGQERFVDGGYYDNVPIHLARIMGAEEIVAVDLKAIGIKQIHKAQKDVLYIEPHVPLGSFLCFDKARIKRNMMLGYQDTMKKFQMCGGTIYTFSVQQKNDIVNFEQAMQIEMEKFEKYITGMGKHKRVKKVLVRQFYQAYRKYEEYQYPCLKLVEVIAYEFGMDDVGIWDFNTFLSQVIKRTRHICGMHNRGTPRKVFPIYAICRKNIFLKAYILFILSKKE